MPNVVNAAAWVRLLRTLDGQPPWVVTDGGVGVLNGVRKAWPDAERWRCEWHLQRNLADKFPSVVQQDLTDPLHGKLKYAQLSEENWDAYRKLLRMRAAAEVGYAAAENAAVKLDGLIRTQAFARPDPSDGYPVSTGSLEQFFRTLELSLGDRAARLTNKRRADALLKLLAANRNGWVATTTHGRPSCANISTPAAATPPSSASTSTPAAPRACAECLDAQAGGDLSSPFRRRRNARPRQPERVARPARDDVEVKVENVLPARRSVGLEEAETVGLESVLEDPRHGLR